MPNISMSHQTLEAIGVAGQRDGAVKSAEVIGLGDE
jgi:hypothetical protein